MVTDVSGLILCLLVIAGCQKDSTKNHHQKVVIDPVSFQDQQSDDFEFVDVRVFGDSLGVTIRYGGGCGNILTSLIDSGILTDTHPVQRNLRLILEDNDPCEAWLETEISFELINLRVADTNEVALNIAGWPTPILYTY